MDKNEIDVEPYDPEDEAPEGGPMICAGENPDGA